MSATTVAVVGLSSVFLTNPVYANSTDVAKERSEIKSKLSTTESEIADILIDLKELNAEIEDVNETLSSNQEALDETKGEIKTTEEEIETLEKEIEELEEKIEQRFEILKERAASYQKSGGDIRYLDVLLGSNSFSEFISRVSAVTKITKSDTELMAAHEADKSAVEENHQEVENKLDELSETKDELEAIEERIKDQKSEIEAKKKSLNGKQKELETVKKDLKIKDGKLAKIEQQVQNSMAAASNESDDSSDSSGDSAKSSGNLNTLSSDTSAPSKGSGQLSWPTAGGYISSPMATRNGRMHKGIDIARTDRSTSPPIYAADNGVVVSAGNDGAYGNKVVIDHGNGLKTVYAHMASIAVSSGQSVSKGTTLGIMGTTGRSTGIHLHFEVYKNGQLQNPMNYL